MEKRILGCTHLSYVLSRACGAGPSGLQPLHASRIVFWPCQIMFDFALEGVVRGQAYFGEEVTVKALRRLVTPCKNTKNTESDCMLNFKNSGI